VDGAWQPVFVAGGAVTGKLSVGLTPAGAWQISGGRPAILFRQESLPTQGWLLDGSGRHVADLCRALAAPEALFGRKEVLAYRSAFAAFLHKPHQPQSATEFVVELLAEFGEAAKAFFQNTLIFAKLSFAAFATPEDGSEPRREAQSLPPCKSFIPWLNNFDATNQESMAVRTYGLMKLHLPVPPNPGLIQ